MIVWNYSSSATLASCVSDPGAPELIDPRGYIVVRRPASVAPANMKSSPWPPGGGATCPERSYHGTRMNKRALTFHTQLHDWSDAQQLTQVARHQPHPVPHPGPPARANTEVYLPVKRHNQIESWTRDVNKFYRPDRGPRVKSGSFMVIDVSKFNLNGDKQDLSRIKSAVFPSYSKARITSAFSSAATGGKQKRFFGTDCHTVNNKLIDTQMHYSAQRRGLYSASTKPGLTGNNTPDVTREDTTLDLQQESDDETLSTMNTSPRGSEGREIPALDSCRAGVESAPPPAPIPLARDILQPQITARSWSNRTLNVISIDDCKLTCRYRPQTIKETHELPTERSTTSIANNVANNLGNSENKETKKTADKASRKVDSKKIDNDISKKVDTGESSGDEADNEEETSEDIVDIAGDHMNSIHISNGEVDPNNNESAVNFEDTEHEPSDKEKENNTIIESGRSEVDSERDEIENGINVNSTSTSTSSSNHVQPGQVNFQSGQGSTETPSDKTSYGRITNLYSNSAVTANTKERKYRRKTQSYKLNHAISDMVEGRRVMNSMERDFDTRTAQFGRTVVEKTNGSQTFQKIHANLRRKIDSFLDTHSAIKTSQFYEQKRNNSCSPASPAPQKNIVSPAPQKFGASPAPQKNGISPVPQRNGLVHDK